MTMTHLQKPNADPMAVYSLPTVPKGAPRIMGVYVETVCGVGVHRSEIATDGKPSCVLCARLLRDTLEEARRCMACGQGLTKENCEDPAVSDKCFCRAGL